MTFSVLRLHVSHVFSVLKGYVARAGTPRPRWRRTILNIIVDHAVFIHEFPRTELIARAGPSDKATNHLLTARRERLTAANFIGQFRSAIPSQQRANCSSVAVTRRDAQIAQGPGGS